MTARQRRMLEDIRKRNTLREAKRIVMRDYNSGRGMRPRQTRKPTATEDVATLLSIIDKELS